MAWCRPGLCPLVPLPFSVSREQTREHRPEAGSVPSASRPILTSPVPTETQLALSGGQTEDT